METIDAYRATDASTTWETLRPGKRECIWQEALELAGVGSVSNPARRVYWLTERTLDRHRHGNALLLPEYVLEGLTTTLPARFEAQDIMALYCDHATHEQFHASKPRKPRCSSLTTSRQTALTHDITTYSTGI